MRIFTLKSCDTCRKAIDAIRAAGHDPVVIDVRADGVSETDRTAILAAFGDKAINRASTTWRGLSSDEKVGDPKVLLAAHPTLMKRPVIEHGGVLYLGWKGDVQTSVLG